MITALYVLIVLVLVCANGFFVASEFALVGVRRSRIQTLATDGDVRAVPLPQWFLLDTVSTTCDSGWVRKQLGAINCYAPTRYRRWY